MTAQDRQIYNCSIIGEAEMLASVPVMIQKCPYPHTDLYVTECDAVVKQDVYVNFMKKQIKNDQSQRRPYGWKNS